MEIGARALFGILYPGPHPHPTLSSLKVSFLFFLLLLLLSPLLFFFFFYVSFLFRHLPLASIAYLLIRLRFEGC